MSGQSQGTCFENVKSVSLTMLEQLAFNPQNLGVKKTHTFLAMSCFRKILTLALQVGGGGNLPPRPGFLTTAPKLLGIFWNVSVTFPGYLLATERQKNFSHISLLSPKFWWEMKGTLRCQMVKNWFLAYLGLGVPQVAKYNGYIHVFMCIQANDSSADFCWLYMQTGSRNPPKPEVVII